MSAQEVERTVEVATVFDGPRHAPRWGQIAAHLAMARADIEVREAIWWLEDAEKAAARREGRP